MDNNNRYPKGTITQLISDILSEKAEIEIDQIDNYVNNILDFISRLNLKEKGNKNIQRQIKKRKKAAKNTPYSFTPIGVCIIALLTCIHYLSYASAGDNEKVFYAVINGKFKKEFNYDRNMYEIIYDMLEKYYQIVNHLTIWLLSTHEDVAKNLNFDIRERLIHKEPRVKKENTFDSELLLYDIYKRINIFRDEFFISHIITYDEKKDIYKKMKAVSLNLYEYLWHIDQWYLTEAEREEEAYFLLKDELEELNFVIKFFRLVPKEFQPENYDEVWDTEKFWDLKEDLESCRYRLYGLLDKFYESKDYSKWRNTKIKKLRTIQGKDIKKFEQGLAEYRKRLADDEEDNDDSQE